MISFTVPLTKKDWDEARGGWRCSVLKIPGAQVRGLYSGSKNDDSWYDVCSEDEIIRWSHGDPPETATLAIWVPDDLKTKDESEQEAQNESVFWKRLSFFVPVVTAAISGPAGWHLKNEAASPTPAPVVQMERTCDTWTVLGKSNLRNLGLKGGNVLARMQPPDLSIDDFGKFRWSIPVQLDPVTKKPVFPRIDVLVQGGDKNIPNPPPIYLGDESTQAIDEKGRTIDLKEIDFNPDVQPQPYDRAQAAKEQPQLEAENKHWWNTLGTPSR